MEHKTFYKNSIQKLKTKNRVLLILFTCLIIVIGIVIAVDVIKYYDNADANVYTSVEEIIENKYDGDAVHISSSDYYYIIYQGKETNKEQLVWSYEEDRFIIFNDFHESTKEAKKIVELFDNYNFTGIINVITHDNKYIMLIERWIIDSDVLVYDNYYTWTAESINGIDYYMKVIDSDKINSNYKIYAENETERIYLFGAEELGIK